MEGRIYFFTVIPVDRNYEIIARRFDDLRAVMKSVDVTKIRFGELKCWASFYSAQPTGLGFLYSAWFPIP